MATAALLNPIDQKFRDVDAKIDVDKHRLEAENAADERARQGLWAAHAARWGDGDGDARRIADRVGYERETADTIRQDRVLRAQMTTRRGLLEDLELQRLRQKDAASATTVVGPAVPMLPLNLPTASGDKKLSALATKRAALVDQLDERTATVDALAPLLVEDAAVLEALIARHRLGLVPLDKVKEQERVVADEQRTSAAASADVHRLRREIADVDAAMDTAHAQLEIERAKAVDRETRTTVFALCDALMVAAPLSAKLFALDRASNSRAAAPWLIDFLNPSEPRAPVREWLQQGLEAGWTPKA